MPLAYPPSPVMATRRRILKEFSPYHDAVWREMRKLQTQYNASKRQNSMLAIPAIFAVAGMVILFFGFHERWYFIGWALLGFAVLIYFLLWPDRSSKTEKENMVKRITTLKQMPEIQQILQALKNGGVEWTEEDDQDSLY